MTEQPIRFPALLLLLCLLMLLAYITPWMNSPAVSLSPGGYDLAEWTSLHPTVRAEQPPLLTTLLLRLPLMCIALITAFAPLRTSPTLLKIVSGVLALALMVGQLPPPEFFTSAAGDPNYQQQFTLAFISLVGTLLAWSGLINRVRRLLIILVALGGAAAGLVGVLSAAELLRGFALHAEPGAGSWLLALCAVLCVVGSIGYKNSGAAD
jgi:hypothetical protein